MLVRIIQNTATQETFKEYAIFEPRDFAERRYSFKPIKEGFVEIKRFVEVDDLIKHCSHVKMPEMVPYSI